MKKATKSDIKRAASLLNRIHRLQADLYDFDDILEGKGLNNIAQLVSNAGFELDASHSEMQWAVKQLQASNYGPQ